ncbi:hypothetical protein [Actinophytocola oryzae]|uniref:Uncharacterized protein n=1 Tax=Actinophytocola oryzae TaxID=502181 RepID=A0A4R7V5X7_9PSEU|nr:hypothetical protein [Actinophytocola oryzae]TDV44162.1 hypothetical protein CLV71_11471 [Actinophytocola oryzae]
MATTHEILRRVEEADTVRSAKRSAAAQQIGDLAQRRNAIAEQLADIERQLGDILETARGVIEIDELARFTDVPVADLTRWSTSRKTPRTRRKRTNADVIDGSNREPPAGPVPMRHTSPVPRPGGATAPGRDTPETT